jgi:hypothetical protein
MPEYVVRERAATARKVMGISAIVLSQAAHHLRILPRGNFMRRLLLATLIALSSSSAFALQTIVGKGTKIGSGCVGPVVALAPKLGSCAIVGSKTRIWCPNGQIFDDESVKSPVSLARSLCNLSQIP